MPYNVSSGVFTNVAGATTATAGQTIASATWDSIHTDYGTAFTQLGPANLPFINGAKAFYYCTPAQTVNFAASGGTDIATFAIASILPPNISTYRIESLRIGNAQGSLGVGNISLYTAASAGGTVAIGSTALTVSTSLPNASGSAQIVIPTSSNTVMWNATQLFLHITTSTSTSSNLANVVIGINPIY